MHAFPVRCNQSNHPSAAEIGAFFWRRPSAKSSGVENHVVLSSSFAPLLSPPHRLLRRKLALAKQSSAAKTPLELEAAAEMQKRKKAPLLDASAVGGRRRAAGKGVKKVGTSSVSVVSHARALPSSPRRQSRCSRCRSPSLSAAADSKHAPAD